MKKKKKKKKKKKQMKTPAYLRSRRVREIRLSSQLLSRQRETITLPQTSLRTGLRDYSVRQCSLLIEGKTL